MSNSSHPSTGDGLEAVRENREALEDLAESDLPVARVAETLLDAVDDADEEGSA